MFGWFRPTCPVDPNAKDWMEWRLEWLGDQFGVDVFARRSVILPEEDFFPDKYDGSPEAVQVLFEQVCRYMDADSDLVELRLFQDRNQLGLVNERGHAIPGAAGLYDERSGKTIIHLETSQFDRPLDLVGTMAHELAHLRLLGENRISPDVFDNELLTDLTVVFHGLGIFLANSPRHYESLNSHWPDTKVRKPEYMTYPMFGYAMAHAAWFRKERKPAWAKHLRTDAHCTFKQGLRYLWETGDSQFKPRHATK